MQIATSHDLVNLKSPKEEFMKKWTIVAMAIAFLGATGGCATKSGEMSDATPAKAEEKTSTEAKAESKEMVVDMEKVEKKAEADIDKTKEKTGSKEEQKKK